MVINCPFHFGIKMVTIHCIGREYKPGWGWNKSSNLLIPVNEKLNDKWSFLNLYDSDVKEFNIYQLLSTNMLY